MKFKLLILFFITCSAHAADEATIQLQGASSSRILHLKSDAGGILCTTKGIPPHHIVVAEFRGLNPPFTGSLDAGKCPQVLTWVSEGKKTATCYRFGSNRVLDDLLRSCTSL